MGKVDDERQFLRSCGFYTDSLNWVQRIVPHPVKLRPTDSIGPPWWHYLNKSGHTGYYQASSSRRGPEYTKDWYSPWFDTLEACYIYAELNRWGL